MDRFVTPRLRFALALLIIVSAVVALGGCSDDVDVTTQTSGNSAGNDSSANATQVPGTPTGKLTTGGNADEAIAARDYNTTVVNPVDGTRSAITVLQPELAPGEAAPLVLQSHGFGGARLTGRDQKSIYEQLSGGILPSTEAARRAAKNGYFVISFDERGFGESGGMVEVMDPRYEGEDIKAILDWAETQMDHREHLGYRNGDLVLGSLGLSYGGGFQLIGAGVDPRFDALVPTAAWYDLTYSLSPDNVVKTTWGVALTGIGIPTSKARLDPFLYKALLEGTAAPLSGTGFSPDVQDRLYNNSPASFCNANVSENGEKVPSATGRTTPQVDALLIQGVADSLFDLNEGQANAQCLRAAGNDVQLIGMRYGHTLPLLQDLDDRIAYRTEATLHCGDQTFETAALELSYLDWKLKGEPPAKPIPHNCITLDDDSGVVFDERIPIGAGATGPTIDFDGQAVTGGLDVLLGVLRENTLDELLELVGGAGDNAAALLTQILDPASPLPSSTEASTLMARLINALPADQVNQLTSGGTFIPLTTMTGNDRALAGIPTIDITVSGNAPSPIAFVGLGVRDDANAEPVLIDKQIRPIRGSGERTLELNGVSQRLQDGDQLGLLVYGYHPQYLASFSAVPGVVNVSGQVALPIVDVP